MFNRKYVIIIFSLLAMALLWPAAMVAAPPEPALSDSSIAIELPQAQDSFPVYNSYEWQEGVGPVSCPPQDPIAIFKYGTRTIISYVPLEFKADATFAFLWYELDEEGNIVGDEPIGVATVEATAGDAVPFGWLSLNKGASGIVGVLMVVQVGEDWESIAGGAYILAGNGVQAPEPGECPL